MKVGVYWQQWLQSDSAGEFIHYSAKKHKARYKVNLIGLQARCATNYALMLRIFPALVEQGEFEFALSECGTVKLNLLERTPYTDLVGMQQSSVAAMIPEMSMCKIRLYHDARLAEVVEWEGQRNLRGRYDYPNAAMHQEDEKFQRNNFLGEWLNHCLSEGRSMVVPEF